MIKLIILIVSVFLGYILGTSLVRIYVDANKKDALPARYYVRKAVLLIVLSGSFLLVLNNLLIKFM